jgi:hypothetical protein
MSYNVFHRKWWQDNPEWPEGLEPKAGRKTYIAKGVSTEEEAREMARGWNAPHKPGRYSHKAEIEEV